MEAKMETAKETNAKIRATVDKKIEGYLAEIKATLKAQGHTFTAPTKDALGYNHYSPNCEVDGVKSHLRMEQQRGGYSYYSQPSGLVECSVGPRGHYKETNEKRLNVAKICKTLVEFAVASEADRRRQDDKNRAYENGKKLAESINERCGAGYGCRLQSDAKGFLSCT
jgi:hypothetical protein